MDHQLGQSVAGLFWGIFALSTVAVGVTIGLLVMRSKSGSQKSKFVGLECPPLAITILVVSFIVWILSLAGGSITLAFTSEMEQLEKAKAP